MAHATMHDLGGHRGSSLPYLAHYVTHQRLCVHCSWDMAHNQRNQDKHGQAGRQLALLQGLVA